MNRQLTLKNVKYGMLVEVLDKVGDGYHAGCKVHFFNEKGVLIGNFYEFLPYERLRLRESDEYNSDRTYPRYFMGRRFEGMRMLFFKILLSFTGSLLKITQRTILK